MAAWSCGGPGPAGEERADASQAKSDPRGFDAIELAADREIIPDKYPRQGVVIGRAGLVDGSEDGSSVGAAAVPDRLGVLTDTLNNQVFRVQLLTTTVYGEARQAVRVAEEIFDRPVYVDYEVPYFKVRVGSFRDRDAAEQYQQKARATGYANAWVVMVTVNTKRAAPLYDEPVPEAAVDDKSADSTESEKSPDE
jgi:hypothetical protein